jgi:hypothetical protein
VLQFILGRGEVAGIDLAPKMVARSQLLGKLPGLIRECGFQTVRLLKKGLFFEYYMIRKGAEGGIGG